MQNSQGIILRNLTGSYFAKQPLSRNTPGKGAEYQIRLFLIGQYCSRSVRRHCQNADIVDSHATSASAVFSHREIPAVFFQGFIGISQSSPGSFQGQRSRKHHIIAGIPVRRRGYVIGMILLAALAELIRNEIRKYDVYQYNESFEFEVHLPETAMVHADEKRIQQVFNNFMTNAINYSGNSRKVIISMTLENGHVRTEVKDFGEGIDEKNLKNIWDRYYKVDKQHVRFSSGSGLGLSIVREILDLHDAEYGVSSKMNEGSTFWFELPLIQK